MAKIIKYILCFFCLSIFGCVDPPSYPDEPIITDITLSDYLFNETDTNIFMYVYFTDGDGDIGSEDTENSPINMYMVDSRTDFEYELKVPFIDSYGNVSDIAGRMTVNLVPFTTCSGVSTRDTMSFTVRLIDRAGRISNEFEGPEFILRCQ